MYPNYFGLKEASFSITPDPQYLFLSEQHREALAHLLYGAGDSGGFVLLTGEVGTGKTTVCRAFLEQLPPAVDVALVLNPAMTAVELLHAVCDEFRVPVPSAEQSAKALVDRLNRFLLDAHARGRRPVLIIDEAQNLRPKVMEQIRLLTNLETAKRKLLQIFLIGQPELRQMLAAPDLRQLNQRITARFHLRPLSLAETIGYVDHRIAIAGVDRPLFTGAALRRVHRCSGGVPRLINLLCDRSLLGAAISRRMQVTPGIVAQAAREVRGTDDPALPRRVGRLGLVAAMLVALVGGVWLGEAGVLSLPDRMLTWSDLLDVPARTAASLAGPSQVDAAAPAPRPMPPTDAAATRTEAAAPSQALEPMPESPPELLAEPRPTAAAPAGEPSREPAPASPVPRIAMARSTAALEEADLDRWSAALVPETGAVDELLQLWGVAGDAVVSGLDCRAVAAFGLACASGQGRWSDLRLFDRPVALRLALDDGRGGYVVIGHLDDEHALVDKNGHVIKVPIALVDERWSGDYLMLWRLPPLGVKVIGRGSGPEVVAWLRERLASLPGAEITGQATGYDAALLAEVKRFQARRGLTVDGIAGPHTLIMLNNELTMADVPRLTQAR